MSLIQFSNVTFAYDGSYDTIFEDVNFQIDTDWKLGLIGRNGRGKTTLLKLLMGEYEYRGSITAAVDFSYFPYEIVDQSVTTAEVVEAMYPSYLEWELLREFSMLELPEDVLYRPFETLSNGEQTKVLLAALFLKEHNFLLIDEPTNHLDLQGRELVSRYLNGKKGFILVSHDRAFLDGCVDHILTINQADIQVRRGNFSSWFANKEWQDQFELAEHEKQTKEIKRLTSAAKRTADWSDQAEKGKYGNGPVDRGYIGHKAAKMMKRSKGTQNRIKASLEEKTKLLKNLEQSEPLKLSPLLYHTNLLAALEDVSIFYGTHPACSHVNFSIEAGERIALRGKNGAGKSSVIKLLQGEELSYTGNVQIGSRLKISYVSQETAGLEGDLSRYARKQGIEESLFKAILRKLDFSRTQFDKDMGQFSQGQKKKVLIAQSLCEQAHLYLWDEPLNFIDMISRMQIEELLLEYRPTILFVEHDQVFCEKIATKTVWI